MVVAGFQGVSENGDITTLGRGGSDTTAVALAYGINADVCEIYSDVEGIYTADPRVAPRARKLSCISYDDMLELSSGGAGVLQARAVEFARKYKVVFIPVLLSRMKKAHLSRRLFLLWSRQLFLVLHTIRPK